MKKIAIIAIVALSSCTSDNHGIIDKKLYVTPTLGNAYPPGICYIGYGDYYIEDSCNKWNIGDTIKDPNLLLK